MFGKPDVPAGVVAPPLNTTSYVHLWTMDGRAFYWKWCMEWGETSFLPKYLPHFPSPPPSCNYLLHPFLPHTQVLHSSTFSIHPPSPPTLSHSSRLPLLLFQLLPLMTLVCIMWPTRWQPLASARNIHQRWVSMVCGQWISLALALCLPYSGKLLREKTFANWWKIWYSQRKFSSQIARFCPANRRHTPKFHGENCHE